MKFNLGLVILLAFLIAKHYAEEDARGDFSKLEELMEDSKTFPVIICSAAISAHVSNKKFVSDMTVMIQQSPIDDIRDNPSQTMHKLVTSAAVGCKEMVKEFTEKEKKEVFEILVAKDFQKLRRFLQIDEDLIRYGGDIRLSDEEKVVERELQELRAKISEHSSQADKKKPVSKDPETQQIEEKVKLLSEQRNNYLWTYGFVFMLSVVGGLGVWIYRPKGKTKFTKEEEEENEKAKQNLLRGQKDIDRQLDIARQMKKILSEQFGKVKEFQQFELISEMKEDELDKFMEGLTHKDSLGINGSSNSKPKEE